MQKKSYKIQNLFMLKIKKDIFNLIFLNLPKTSRNVIMWDTKTDFSKKRSKIRLLTGTTSIK